MAVDLPVPPQPRTLYSVPQRASLTSGERTRSNGLLLFSLMGWLAVLMLGQVERDSALWGWLSIASTMWLTLVWSRFRLVSASICFVVLYSLGQSNFVFDRGLPQILQYLDDLIVIALSVLLASRLTRVFRLRIGGYVLLLTTTICVLGLTGGVWLGVPLWVIVLALLRSVILGSLLMFLVASQKQSVNDRSGLLGILMMIVWANVAAYVGQFLRVRDLFPSYDEDLYYGIMGGGFANDVSLLMGMLAAVWLAKVLFDKSRGRKDIFILLGLLSAMVLSKSLTVLYTWPLLIAGSLVIVFFRQPHRKLARKHWYYWVLGSSTYLGVLVGIVGLWSGLGDVAWEVANQRLSALSYQLSYADVDTVNRFALVQRVWEYGFPTTLNLVIGNGPGTFMGATANSGIYVSPITRLFFEDVARARYIAPSRLASLLVEYGLVGTVMNLLLPLGLIAWAFERFRRVGGDGSAWLALGFALAGVVLLPAFVTGGALETQGIGFFFWFLAGLAVGEELPERKAGFGKAIRIELAK